MDEYHISNLPQRFLMTQHYQSSMEQPNLDNVEAKLQVARQRNHQLAQQYFRNKYGSAAAYEEFARTHNMGELVVESQPTPEQLLIRHLDRKAKQIQHNFYQQQEFERPPQYSINIKQPEWLRKQAKKPSNNNPWMKQPKSTQKPKSSDLDTGLQYVDSLIAPKDKQSQFISQFKNYLDHKYEQKQEEKTKQPNQSSFNRTTQSKLYSPSKVHNKSIASAVQTEAQERKKCYEEELGKKIFKDIVGESKDETKIEKLALVEYINKNKKILKVLGLMEAQLNNQILKVHPTKSDSQISLQQFVFFILKTVGKQKQINELKQQKRSKNIPQGCMLSKQTIIHFQKIFKELDTHTDLIIKRMPYIDRLANDPYIRTLLNSPAVFEPEINKSITLRRVFERIEMECMFGSQDQQKVKEYISWNQFLDYFKSGHAPQVLYNLVNLIDSLHKSDAMGLVEVPDIAMEIITQVITKVPCRSGYFNTLALIQAIVKHPEYDHEKYTQVRQESKIAGLPSEAFEQVLARIKQTGDKFMTLKEFLQYFSSKGRPIQQFEQIKLNSARKNFSGVKVKFAAEELNLKQQKLDGYDSDPQIYQSKVFNKSSQRKSGRSAKKLEQATSFIQQSKSRPSNKRQFKVTIPVPFGFEEREKQRKEKLEPVIEAEQQFQHFRAKPVPSKVLQQGLYYKMLEQDRKKIQQRRKSCMIMTLANEQPFSFLNRKTNKKTKQQREQYIFKAKPIPWYCSVDLLQKKKQAEILRNEKIAKEAQENLAKAKLPPRMERDFQQKQAKLAMTENQKLNRPQSKPKAYKEPPDFDKLHRQFEQGLERKRKQNKTTKPQQFNFSHKSRPKTAIPSKTQQQFMADQQNKQKMDYKRLLESKPVAASTAKYEQQVEKRRQEMEKKRKEEEQKKKQDEERKKIDEDLKSKLMAAVKTKQFKQQEQRQKRNKIMAEEMKSFQQWKKGCIQKGRNQPMLVNRPLKRDEKIEKMKKLYQIGQTLKSNGIKGKDHDSYFKKQELLMLQDWELLKDRIQ